jgi:hypothetical protein
VPTCFVIQPFDGGGKFDKRFDDVFAPAVKDAGLEPYRVDQDPAVSIPIEAIEQGIRGAAICLAEITTDNPNVWFELGYALATGKDVIMVCDQKERAKKFPFDVQHRSIITYGTESPSDFAKLRNAITGRMQAMLKKGRDLETLAASPLRAAEGLSPHEITCLAVMAENVLTPGDWVWPSAVERDMSRAGYRKVASNISLHGLLKKGMIEAREVPTDDGWGTAYGLSEKGQEWLLENQDKLVLRKPSQDDPPF